MLGERDTVREPTRVSLFVIPGGQIYPPLRDDHTSVFVFNGHNVMLYDRTSNGACVDSLSVDRRSQWKHMNRGDKGCLVPRFYVASLSVSPSIRDRDRHRHE
ncbi:hypothetical protein GW17_00048166 [Ensete ventricosum]|nr:hypothetical protein GW17_00048166 [Ensete ventricosum]